MNRLKMLREQKKLFQSDMAKILNITTSSYGYYENEKRKIPDDIKIILCNFFDCSIDYLMGYSNSKQIKKEENDDDVILYEEIEGLAEHDKEIIKNLVKSLKTKK